MISIDPALIPLFYMVIGAVIVIQSLIYYTEGEFWFSYPPLVDLICGVPNTPLFKDVKIRTKRYYKVHKEVI